MSNRQPEAKQLLGDELDRLRPDTHHLGTRIEPALHSLDHMLVLLARDAPFRAGAAQHRQGRAD